MTSPRLQTALSPGRLGPLTLRNRFIKAATFEGMTPDGAPTERLIRFHRAIAAGGVAMTTVAYCSVSDVGRTFSDQIVMSSGVRAPLTELTRSVHEAGAHAAVQLGHAGFFSKHRIPRRWAPAGPSWNVNAYGVASGMPLGRPMTRRDIERTIYDFARAAEHAVEAGFDALEIHLGHGYLLSQFLSPATNRRRDGYGGTLSRRCRLPLEVLSAIRSAIGKDVALVCKMNAEDGFPGGLDAHQAGQIGGLLEASGLVDGLILSGGFTSRNAMFLLRGGRPLQQMAEVEKSPLQRIALRAVGRWVVQRYPFEEFFFEEASKVVTESLKLPRIAIGGASSAEGIERTLDTEGFSFVQLGRALIRDPGFVNRLRDGAERSDCIRCNICITEMDRPEGTRCVMPPRRKPRRKPRPAPATVSTVLITGGLGEVGQALTRELLRRGIGVRILERPTARTLRRADSIDQPLSVTWGDVRDVSAIEQAADGCDAVVHLASMLPPATERELRDAIDVNISATDALLQQRPPLFIYVSSYTVYGPARSKPPRLRHEEDPVAPTDIYTHAKVACEQHVRESGSNYLILRLATVPPLSGIHVDPRLVLGQLLVRPDAPIEMMHPRDCAFAIAQAIATPRAWNSTLNLGGGQSCQIRQRDLMRPLSEILGWNQPLPDTTFGHRDYYSQWLNTERSRELLGNYQRHTWGELCGQIIEAANGQTGLWRTIPAVTRGLVPRALARARRFGTL